MEFFQYGIIVGFERSFSLEGVTELLQESKISRNTEYYIGVEKGQQNTCVASVNIS